MYMESINEFKGQYRWLSNFGQTQFGIVIDGRIWKTTQHYYQAMKTNNVFIQDHIRGLDTPGKAKREGASIKPHDDWFNINLSVMEKAVTAKFDQYEDLKKRLINTYPLQLIEGNTWGDKFWGVDLKTGKGENNLGKILMNIRKKYVEEIDKNNK